MRSGSHAKPACRGGKANSGRLARDPLATQRGFAARIKHGARAGRARMFVASTQDAARRSGRRVGMRTGKELDPWRRSE